MDSNAPARCFGPMILRAAAVDGEADLAGEISGTLNELSGGTSTGSSNKRAGKRDYLTGKAWAVKLDLGREEGTWMDARFVHMLSHPRCVLFLL
jgi:hypothetical protein